MCGQGYAHVCTTITLKFDVQWSFLVRIFVYNLKIVNLIIN